MTKILLVEDDKSLREIYGVRLQAEGYEIVSAGDGEEALAMAVKERPELILSDVMMPKISGFDMLDILRSTPETKDIKVIMMTALSSEDQRARGESLGADRYLVKSQVGIEDVVRTVHDVLRDIPGAAPAPDKPAGPAASATPINQPKEQITPKESSMQPDPATNDQQNVTPPLIPTAMPIPPTPTEEPQTFSTPAPAVTPPVAEVSTPAPSVNSTPTIPEEQLPQPTAPFSTPAPASLGDKVVEPITPAAPAQDISSLINQELGGNTPAEPTPAVAPETPAEPATPPIDPVTNSL